MNSYSEKIISYLNGILDKTKKGQIDWSKSNATTFIAHVVTADARLTLQKVSGPSTPVRVSGGTIARMAPTSRYQLNVIDTATNAVVLTLDSRTDSKAQEVLMALFNIAEDTSMKNGADVLRRIVEG